MEVADDAQFCVKLLYDKFGSLKVCSRVAATTLRTCNVVAWAEGVPGLGLSVCSTAHQVPMYNVILSILPTISVMVLLKLLDIAIEQSQPEVFTCASAAGGLRPARFTCVGRVPCGAVVTHISSRGVQGQDQVRRYSASAQEAHVLYVHWCCGHASPHGGALSELTVCGQARH